MKNRKTKSENNLQLCDALIGAIYGRASTDALVEGESLKKQEYYGLKYAEQLSSQLGIQHTVKYILIEESAASGADRDRKKLKVLMTLIKAKKIKFLIIEELSRLSRILAHLLETLQTCKEFGVAVYIRSLPGVSVHSAAGEFLLGTLGSAAQFERALTIERVKNTLRAAALREGKINGGSVVYGFKRDTTKKGSWIPVPEELKNIELLMEKFVACGSVAEALEFAKTLGIKNKSGNYFTFSSIKKLFECRKLIGELLVRHGVHDEQQTIVKLPFGEVINRQLFEKVQAALAQHESLRTNMNRRGDKRLYINNGGSQDFCYTWFTTTKFNERNPKCPHQFTNLSSVCLTSKSFPIKAVKPLRLRLNTLANASAPIAKVKDFARKTAFYGFLNITPLESTSPFC